MLSLEAANAVDLCIECIILTDTYIGAGMEMGAALPDKDIAGENELTVRALGPKTLGLTLTTVTGATDALFMCKELKIEPEHIKL